MIWGWAAVGFLVGVLAAAWAISRPPRCRSGCCVPPQPEPKCDLCRGKKTLVVELFGEEMNTIACFCTKPLYSPPRGPF